MLTTAVANAQIKQGQFMAGGNAGFSSEKVRDNKTTSWNISPAVGYFVVDKLAVGIEANYMHEKYTWKSASGPVVIEGEDKSRRLGFAPFVRYYFLPAAQKVNVFAHGAYGFGSTKSNDNDSESFSFYRFAAGPAFFLSPSVALEANVFYMSYKDKNDADRTNSFGLQVGFQIHLGKGKK
ncbi:hypothetical protein GCM10011379_48950 [Filimonas zeae]|uniref:Outer membrane protein beta-barrel domain-containing protein n=1 Tax=Filimonas zeae TaxID=1737353 RepID=A0A917MYU6_9BACT|nr:hypothetical protein GCM10011379_48950 [Filimonas zeae]